MMRIIKSIFPEKYFPTRESIIAYVIACACLFILVLTIGFLPTRANFFNQEYNPPRELNGLVLAVFILSLSYFAFESRKR